MGLRFGSLFTNTKTDLRWSETVKIVVDFLCVRLARICHRLMRVRDFHRFDDQELLKGLLACSTLRSFRLDITSPKESDVEYSKVVEFSETLLNAESRIERLRYVNLEQVSFNHFL